MYSVKSLQKMKSIFPPDLRKHVAIGSFAEHPVGTSYLLFIDKNIHCECDSIVIHRYFKVATHRGRSSHESQGCLLIPRKETGLLRVPHPERVFSHK